MLFNRIAVTSLLSVAMLCSLASTASATTYTYTGNNFTNVSGVYTTAMSIDISVTLSITLSANLNDFDSQSSVTSFTATDGVRVITEASAELLGMGFVVDTDAAGGIVAWDFALSLAGGGNQFATCTLGVFTGACQVGQQPAIDVSFNPAGGTGSVLDAGAWATVVPEPNTALLLAVGLAGLGWRKYSKQS